MSLDRRFNAWVVRCLNTLNPKGPKLNHDKDRLLNPKGAKLSHDKDRLWKKVNVGILHLTSSGFR